MCTSGDGIYFKPRLDYDKQCLLVIIGAGEAGHKNIVAVSDGDRESEQSWLGGLASLRGADAHGAEGLAGEPAGRTGSPGAPDRRASCRRSRDGGGEKHVLGLAEGATENTASVQALIDNRVERGLDPVRPRLYIVDGAKALSKAIRRSFGQAALI